MNDLKPFKQGEEGTHSICNKHNIGGKSICCKCSGKVGCGDEPMIHTDKILEEFDEKFPPVECSAHERTSSALCICEDLPDINAENVAIKSFLADSIHQAVAEERARVWGNLPKIITPTVEPPPNGLSQNQIFAIGQMNMLLRVFDLLESLEDKK